MEAIMSNMRIKHLAFVFAAAAALAALAQSPTGHLAVHEWGTFTSFQGSDGTVLPWKPLVTSQLPSFVYDWQRPGLPRHSLLLNSDGTFGKGRVASLQRMETPVVYFYSDQALTADISVRFPKGDITEWFPHASEVGPSIAAIDSSTDARRAIMQESLIHWANVHVLPINTNTTTAFPLPTDKSGSHYFSARDTESATLEIDASPTNHEFEKFLFYRGVGFFETPLRVVMKSDDAVNIANTGNEPLANLFVLDIKGDTGRFVYVPELASGAVKTVLLNSPDLVHSLDETSTNIAAQMTMALTTTGLYPREASAMVNTWKDSWFKEEGVRVLYVLPRAWTDRTLPMTLKPAPHEVVRTMIGRAEVLPPGVEHELVADILSQTRGATNVSPEIHQILRSLGRFAEPALNLAIADAKLGPQDHDALLTSLGRATKFE
jgi:hypothetical protein